VDVLKGQPTGAVAYIGGEVSQRRMLRLSEIHTPGRLRKSAWSWMYTWDSAGPSDVTRCM